jgi:UDP-glucose 4-epimerase
VDLVCAYRPNVIVHLAAQSDAAASVVDPTGTHSINVDGTKMVARAAVAAGVERLVFASTAAVYGNLAPELLPLCEDAPTSPLTPYGASKLEAEAALADILRPAGVDFAVVRMSNVYGPRQGGGGEGGVVACFCSALAQGKRPVIFGDGKQTRDFVYVVDIVSAFVSLIGGDIAFAGSPEEPTGAIYHLSTGHAISIEQLALSVRRITGQFDEFEHEARREGDICDSVLSPEKAAQVFEWNPRIELEQGLTNTWRWFARQ